MGVYYFFNVRGSGLDIQGPFSAVRGLDVQGIFLDFWGWALLNVDPCLEVWGLYAERPNAQNV